MSEGALGKFLIFYKVKLAIQSASDTYNATENYIQTETNQLLAEFDGVTKDTEFNEINVLMDHLQVKLFKLVFVKVKMQAYRLVR